MKDIHGIEIKVGDFVYHAATSYGGSRHLDFGTVTRASEKNITFVDDRKWSHVVHKSGTTVVVNNHE